jgi:signal transduction histidine kinase
MLREFVADNRDTILAQARERVINRSGPPTTDEDRTRGLPVFLDQLREALRKATAGEMLDHTEIQRSAYAHGRDLFHHGLTVDQVVHDYGDLCQVITGLAVEQGAAVGVDEFQTLNLCLDDAIAGAVTAYSKEHDRAVSDEGTELLGVLAHEMRSALNAAILAFGSIKTGVVAPLGSTGAMLDRTLLRLQALIDRSLADVRLDAGMRNVEAIAVREIVDEVTIGATLSAELRGVELSVTRVDHTVFVEADRPIIEAAVANLVQNALKFTRPGTTVKLRTSSTPTRALIEVEDECGGLPPGKVEDLFRPFGHPGTGRSRVGSGLSICFKAANASGGELRVRDLPGQGCIFTLDLPRKPPPPLVVVEGGKGKSSATATSSKSAEGTGTRKPSG